MYEILWKMAIFSTSQLVQLDFWNIHSSWWMAFTFRMVQTSNFKPSLFGVHPWLTPNDIKTHEKRLDHFGVSGGAPWDFANITDFAAKSFHGKDLGYCWCSCSEHRWLGDDQLMVPSCRCYMGIPKAQVAMVYSLYPFSGQLHLFKRWTCLYDML